MNLNEKYRSLIEQANVVYKKIKSNPNYQLESFVKPLDVVSYYKNNKWNSGIVKEVMCKDWINSLVLDNDDIVDTNRDEWCLGIHPDIIDSCDNYQNILDLFDRRYNIKEKKVLGKPDEYIYNYKIVSIISDVIKYCRNTRYISPANIDYLIKNKDKLPDPIGILEDTDYIPQLYYVNRDKLVIRKLLYIGLYPNSDKFIFCEPHNTETGIHIIQKNNIDNYFDAKYFTTKEKAKISLLGYHKTITNVMNEHLENLL